MDESESMPALHAYSHGNGVLPECVMLPEDRSPSDLLSRGLSAVPSTTMERNELQLFIQIFLRKGEEYFPPFQNMSDTIIVIVKLCIV
jgi:hypothetical protein